MLLILEIILLVIGLGISLLTIKKEKGENSSEEKNTRKKLAKLYLLFLALSIIILGVKYIDTKQTGLELSTSLNTLVTNVLEISDSLKNIQDSLKVVLDKVRDLKSRTEEIVAKTEKAIKQREVAQKLFDEQNKILEKSNALTQKQIEEREPAITITTPDITFKSIDSDSTECNIVLRNYGKRVANKVVVDVLLFLRDKNKDGLIELLSTSDTLFDFFPSEQYSNPLKHIFWHIPIKYNNLLSYKDGGIIISINTWDKLTNNNIPDQRLFNLKIKNGKIMITNARIIPNDVKEVLKKIGDKRFQQ